MDNITEPGRSASHCMCIGAHCGAHITSPTGCIGLGERLVLDKDNIMKIRIGEEYIIEKHLSHAESRIFQQIIFGSTLRRVQDGDLLVMSLPEAPS